MIHKAFKYRIYPTKEQKVLLSKMFGCSRFVWNHFLNKEIENYSQSQKEKKTYLGFYSNCKSLTELKKEENTSFLKETNSQSIQATLKQLDDAYKSFFKGKTKFPRFKSKQNRQSVKIPQSISIDQNKLYIPKFKEKGILINLHRPYQGKIVNACVSKTPSEKYYASIVCEIDNPEQYPRNTNVIGIDLGIKTFAVCSNETFYDRKEKFLHAQEKKLKFLQRQASIKKKKKGLAKPKTKGSRNHKKTLKQIAQVHATITNKRDDFLHKTSTDIVKKNNTIILEDLSVKNMVKNHKLAKSISDCSWSKFVSMLEYKSKWHDRTIVKVNRFFPSSKTCSDCGWIKEDLTLKDREWICESCGVVHDRDINAAQNIKKEGLKNFLENQEKNANDNCLVQDLNNTDTGLDVKASKWKKQKPVEASSLEESTKQEVHFLRSG